jgi:signal peptidase II
MRLLFETACPSSEKPVPTLSRQACERETREKNMAAARMIFWGAFWAFLVDQASKYLVIHWMGLSQRLSIDVLPPLLNFRYGENTGINFGLFGGGDELARWLLIGLSLVICLALVLWVGRGND